MHIKNMDAIEQKCSLNQQALYMGLESRSQFSVPRFPEVVPYGDIYMQANIHMQYFNGGTFYNCNHQQNAFRNHKPDVT